MERNTVTIDAENQVMGRLATKIANVLRGKVKPTYVPYIDGGDFVTVKNVQKMKITGNKMRQKKYYHHTGFPGGLRTQTMKEIFIKNPGEILKKAVYGMLPKNKLRALQIKRLQFEK